MMQFLEADIGRLQASVREAVISQTEEALRGSLWDGQLWTADYRRIRVVATKALNMLTGGKPQVFRQAETSL
jgi:hypothetical protein